MAYLEIESGKSIYFEYYPGKRPPVMLIHGWGVGCRIWDEVLVWLQDAGYAVITFDQRGCGRSDKDFIEVSVERSALDAVAILDHLGLDSVIVNGWSIGGAISVAASALLGNRCKGVISTAGATPRPVQAPDWSIGMQAGAAAKMVETMRPDRATFLHGMAEATFALPVSEAVKSWMLQLMLQNGPSADRALLSLDTIDQRDILRHLDAPFLAIAGAMDAFVPLDVLQNAADEAKHGQLEVFDGCGHAPFLEVRDRYKAVVLNFLASVN